VPTGFHGVLSSSTRDAGVTAAAIASGAITNRPPSMLDLTGFTHPPASSIGDRYAS
jgi:hypothetical protein